MRTLMIAGVVAGSFALTACDRLVDPLFPSDAEQFSPPPVYSTWWNMTQACSGLTGSLGAVTWYKTSEALRNPETGEAIIGYWNSATNGIVMMTSAMLDGRSVRHEMLHALVQKRGHPRNQFLGKCAGTVNCRGRCLTDAGPYPPPPESPIHIDADSLDLTVDIKPANPSYAHDDGHFSITVIARNRAAHWATVIPPSFFVPDSMRTFSFDVRGTGVPEISGGEIASDPSERIFAPGESKRMVFDLRIGDAARQLLPGDHIARGAFSYYWSANNPFVIGP